MGESQFLRGEIHCGTLYIYVLCVPRHVIIPPVKEEREGDKEEDVETVAIDTDTDSLARRCITLINNPAHVAGLVRTVEQAGGGSGGGGGGGVSGGGGGVSGGGVIAAATAFSSGQTMVVTSLGSAAKYSEAETMRHLCRVCHQLLMYNSQVEGF